MELLRLIIVIVVVFSAGCAGMSPSENSQSDVGCTNTGNLVGETVAEAPPNNSVSTLGELPDQDAVSTVLRQTVDQGSYAIDLSVQETKNVEEYLLSLSATTDGFWYIEYNDTIVQLQFSCDA